MKGIGRGRISLHTFGSAAASTAGGVLANSTTVDGVAAGATGTGGGVTTAVAVATATAGASTSTVAERIGL